MTRKSCDSHVYTGNRLRHLKKKKKSYKGPAPTVCTIANETSDIQMFYCYSYFFLTGNDSGVMGFSSRKS